MQLPLAGAKNLLFADVTHSSSVPCTHSTSLADAHDSAKQYPEQPSIVAALKGFKVQLWCRGSGLFLRRLPELGGFNDVDHERCSGYWQLRRSEAAFYQYPRRLRERCGLRGCFKSSC
jgi:hypothetical protein